ncbi:MAG: methyltransferase domain-containing protein [Brevinematia bacterium]
MVRYKGNLFKLCSWDDIYRILESDNIVLEIGSGNGVFLEYLGRKFVNSTVVGIEIDVKRAKKCKKKIEKGNLSNTFIICGDAFEILPMFFRDCSVYRVYMNFPEPWPRESCWRNRVFEIGFMSLIDRVVKTTGLFFLVTDVKNVFLTVNDLLTSVLGNWVFREDFSEDYRRNFVPTLYFDKWLSENREFWWGVWEKKKLISF